MPRGKEVTQLATQWSEAKPPRDYTFAQILSKWTNELGVSNHDLAQSFSADLRSVKAWQEEDRIPQREVRYSLIQMASLYNKLQEDFDTPETARIWLRAGSRYLRGISPLDALRARRIDLLEASLEVLESGLHI